MNMNEVIARINELAHKAKTPEGLTPEELKERDKLRRIYIDSVKANLVGQLENTYIVRPDGTKEKVEKKIYLPGEKAEVLMSSNEEVKNFVLDLDLDVK